MISAENARPCAHAIAREPAIDYARHSVRVNPLAPGATDTLMRADAPEASRQAIRQATPQGRMSRSEEIAASTEATLAVDGGITACW